MNKFSLILILIFSFQSWTKADDIRDFQIEDMSIGDSLLDHFSEREIINLKNFYSETGDLYIFSSKEFYSITFTNHKKFNKYEDLQIVLKDNDTNYKIYAIQGIINYVNNISKCTKELDNIEIELDKIFKISDKSKRNILNTESDRVGKYTLDRFAYFVGNNTVQVSCADYLDNEKFNIRDALRIAIRSEEFNKFVDTQ